VRSLLGLWIEKDKLSLIWETLSQNWVRLQRKQESLLVHSYERLCWIWAFTALWAKLKRQHGMLSSQCALTFLGIIKLRTIEKLLVKCSSFSKLWSATCHWSYISSILIWTFSLKTCKKLVMNTVKDFTKTFSLWKKSSRENGTVVCLQNFVVYSERNPKLTTEEEDQERLFTFVPM